MGSFFKGDMHRAAYSTNEIQNRRRPRRQHRLQDQPATLVQYRHRDRIPVDIQPDISHTIHLGVPFFRLVVVCFITATAAYSKGAPFYNAWPIQARLWLEWGSSTAGKSLPAARSRFRAVHSDSISTDPMQTFNTRSPSTTLRAGSPLRRSSPPR